MDTASLVSIVLPVFNGAAYVRRAIDSVLAQTYENWELIVWNDGSTDNTEEVVRSYHHERIGYHRDQNRGVSYARNRAIELARGEYVAFLDSDDEWAAAKLSEQVQVMSSHPQIDLLFTDFLNVNVSSKRTGRGFEQCSHAMDLLGVERAGENLFMIRTGFLEGLSDQDFIATDTVLSRREMLQEAGGFNEELRNTVDFELWWRMGLAGVGFAYLDRPYLTRYKYPGSLSSPGIEHGRSRIAALGICVRESTARGRSDLIAHLRHCYSGAWLGMISAYGAAGDRRRMLKAFRESAKYGLRPGAFRLLAQAVWKQTVQTRARAQLSTADKSGEVS